MRTLQGLLAVGAICVGLAAMGQSVQAAGLTINDLIGRWCTEAGTYLFTKSRLTVSFKSGQPNRVLVIDSVVATDAWIELKWKPPYDNTVFEDFSPDKRSMAQKGNPELKLPTRKFRRC